MSSDKVHVSQQNSYIVIAMIASSLVRTHNDSAGYDRRIIDTEQKHNKLWSTRDAAETWGKRLITPSKCYDRSQYQSTSQYTCFQEYP